MTIISELKPRLYDDFGSGKYRASRGSRTHRGIDLLSEAGEFIETAYPGIVTKIGFPYANNTVFKYVEIKDRDGFRHRFFYVLPMVNVGDSIQFGDIIGISQDIAGRYNAPFKVMRNHIHYEIKVGRRHIDPTEFLE